MIKQSFSVENLRYIVDIENRKGNNLVGKFFPNVEVYTYKIKTLSSDIKRKKALKDKVGVEKLKEEKKELKQKKEELLKSELKELCKKIHKTNHSIRLRKFNDQRVGEYYKVDESKESFFLIKQLQKNLKLVADVEQSSRNEIISQVKTLLQESIPKTLIKADLSSFYESIPAKRLLNLIDSDIALSVPTKKYIKKVLHEFWGLRGVCQGVPRGVGISAYLSELFMKEVDSELKDKLGALYYARYVDDIVMIFVEDKDSPASNRLAAMEKVILDYGLTLNFNKTKEFHNPLQNQSYEFDFLGYNFKKLPKTLTVKITTKRIDKIKKRIIQSFNLYKRAGYSNERKARVWLVKRLRFLTSNIKLMGNKQNALSGIYYSNIHITDDGMGFLNNLDNILQAQISQLNSTKLKSRLSKYKFSDGFKYRKITKFKLEEMKIITEGFYL